MAGRLVYCVKLNADIRAHQKVQDKAPLAGKGDSPFQER